jgi:hypothetical protein
MDVTVSVIIKHGKQRWDVVTLISECSEYTSKLICTINTRRKAARRTKEEETKGEIKNRDRETYLQMGKRSIKGDRGLGDCGRKNRLFCILKTANPWKGNREQEKKKINIYDIYQWTRESRFLNDMY